MGDKEQRQGSTDVSALMDRAHLTFVTNERGAEVQRRLDALNLGDREFERRTGVDRKTLRRAIDEGEKTRESTWRSIEGALDTLEARFRGEPTPAAPTRPGDPHVITIRGSRGGDIDVAVSGPIEDLEALTATVERLLRVARDDEQDDPK